MIRCTRLNNTEFIVNADMIETLEATPDTIVTLTNERKYVVRESVDEIINRVIAYQRACNAPLVPESTVAEEGAS